MCIVPGPVCELYPGSSSERKARYGCTKVFFLNAGRGIVSIELSIGEKRRSWDRGAPMISVASTVPMVAMSLAMISHLLIYFLATQHQGSEG